MPTEIYTLFYTFYMGFSVVYADDTVTFTWGHFKEHNLLCLIFYRGLGGELEPIRAIMGVVGVLALTVRGPHRDSFTLTPLVNLI